MVKERKSNIELLRIISIFLILVVHATYCSFGTPTINEIQNNPTKSFFYIGIENISVICVDVFVLISGWFGIHPQIKNIGSLFFQCIYFSLLMCLLGNVTDLYSIGINDYTRCFIHFPHFVVCYAVMYMLVPTINTFIKHSSKNRFALFLSAYYTWAFVFGWLLHSDENFANGNTALAFVGLYMLARYVRLHINIPPPLAPCLYLGTHLVCKHPSSYSNCLGMVACRNKRQSKQYTYKYFNVLSCS